MANCGICTETYNRSTRKCVQCPRCRAESCTSCIEKYLLGSMMDAHCMHCREVFDPLFLRRNLTASFLDKVYKTHRETMLWERQRALLPATMPLVDSYREILRIEEEMTQMRTKIADLHHRLRRRERRIQHHRIAIERATRTGVLPNLNEEDIIDAFDITEATETNRDIHFRRACGRRPECNGFIHSRTGHCGSCTTFTCVACDVHVGPSMEGHECREDDIAQWRHIHQSTKPCPGCRVRIEKQSGCDQMWCPNCHTAFSWSRGTVERGAIHNPHYYDWLFSQNNHHQQGRLAAAMAPGGVDAHPCVEPGFYLNIVLQTHYDRDPLFEGNGPEDTNIFLQEIRKISHIHHVDLPRLVRNMGNNQRYEGELVKTRFDFIMNKMTVDDWKTRVQRLEKANRKQVEFNRVFHTFVVASLDVIDRFAIDHTISKREVVQHLHRIREMGEEGFRDLNQCYKSRVTFASFTNE